MATGAAVMGVIRAARPALKDAHQRVAFAVHAAFLAAGYSLTAVGSQAAASGSAAPQEEAEIGIEGWDDMEGAYTFRYAGGGQKNLARAVVVRCVSMGDLLMVEAARLLDTDAAEAPLPHNLEIKVTEYAVDACAGNYQQQFKNIDGLVASVNTQILSQLSETSKSSGPSVPSATQREPAREARRPSSGSVLEDVTQPGPGFGLVTPPIPAYGGSDLLPGSGAGVFPRRDPNGFDDGGMLLGPNSSLWGRIGPDDGFRGGLGVPPGARFDPYGPPGVPGFEPNRFARPPPGRGPHPDVEHFNPF